jgi:hypothetical protein
MTQTTPPPPSTNGASGAESDELYEFMMEGIPYRYDEGIDPRFLTRPEAQASPDPAIRDEARRATENGPGGMMYQVVGPALQYPGDDGKLTKEDEQDILLHKSPDGLWWHYDGIYYRVTKALKIPYVVMQDGKQVVKHILVGYSGIDGPG